MIEMLLLALNLTDAELYREVDIYSNVFDKLTTTTEDFGIAIIGPKVYNKREHLTYPLFSIWKTNNLDNKYFIPAGKAYIIISQVETKEVIILHLDTTPDKMPLPGEPSEPNYPPGYDRNQKITSYDNIWKDITEKDISWIDGNYTIQIICGKMSSNVLNVKVTGTAIKAEDIIKTKQIKQPGDLDNINRKLFERLKFSPQIPEKSNTIEIKIPGGVEPDKIEFIVYGGFKLPTSIVNYKHVIGFSLIVQYSSENGLIHKKINIPVEFISKEGSNLSGYFSYDLKELLFNSPTKKMNIPEIVFVNVLCGTVISNTVQLVKGVSK